MFELFQMWALVEVLGFACLPLTVTVFSNLPDRGWAFSKAIGMVLLAFLVWFPLMSIHALPFNQLFILSVLLLLVACNVVGLLRTRHALVKLVRFNAPYIVITEAVFLGMVFLMGWIRSYGPDIRSFEMYMDEGFIAAIMRSPHLPPSDMWYAGQPINYYYYAHFTIVVLAKLLGQTPSIAFNTGICIFFGLTAVTMFGVTCNIVSWARHVRRNRASETAQVDMQPATQHPNLLPAVPYGFLTFVVGLILGNLDATQQWFKTHGDNLPFDWFAPSRVIDKTINEFPAFSFLLSCFHAHVLALAFTILAIGLAFNVFLETEGKGLHVFGRGWRLPLTLATMALALGSLFLMNSWDFPTYVGLVIVCIALQQWLVYRGRLSFELVLDIFTASASLVALSFLLYLPFYLTFVSPSQGIGIVAATDRSQLRDELLIYGFFAFMFLSLLITSVSPRARSALSAMEQKVGQGSVAGSTSRLPLIGTITVALLAIITLLVMRNGATFVIAAAITLFGVVLVLLNLDDRSRAFTLLLGTVAFALVAGCEILFLKDVFAGNYPRMNTIFKFYFQAWALLSVTSGAGLFFILEGLRPLKSVSSRQRRIQLGITSIWGVGFLLLLLAGAVYPLASFYPRFSHIDYAAKSARYYLTRTNSLDGLTYLQSDPAHPGDYAAIRWLNANVQGNPVIVEAVGPDYSDYARMSAFTGLPTIMGWVGHEYQWRVNWLNAPANGIDFGRRSSDVDLIYANTDPNVVLSVMKNYHAAFLYVGPLEYQKYPTANLHRFSSFMQVVYNSNGVTIYKVK